MRRPILPGWYIVVGADPAGVFLPAPEVVEARASQLNGGILRKQAGAFTQHTGDANG